MKKRRLNLSYNKYTRNPNVCGLEDIECPTPTPTTETTPTPTPTPPPFDSGPWCVNISWDLLLDDINDEMPGIPYQSSATVWINSDGNSIRKCKNGVAVNDAPFTDTGCTGTIIGDFCDQDISYGGTALDGELSFTFEFNAYTGNNFVLYHGSGFNIEGVNIVNEDLSNGNGIMLTGTVTFSVESDIAEENCGC